MPRVTGTGSVDAHVVGVRGLLVEDDDGDRRGLRKLLEASCPGTVETAEDVPTDVRWSGFDYLAFDLWAGLERTAASAVEAKADSPGSLVGFVTMLPDELEQERHGVDFILDKEELPRHGDLIGLLLLLFKAEELNRLPLRGSWASRDFWRRGWEKLQLLRAKHLPDIGADPLDVQLEKPEVLQRCLHQLQHAGIGRLRDAQGVWYAKIGEDVYWDEFLLRFSTRPRYRSLDEVLSGVEVLEVDAGDLASRSFPVAIEVMFTLEAPIEEDDLLRHYCSYSVKHPPFRWDFDIERPRLTVESDSAVCLAVYPSGAVDLFGHPDVTSTGAEVWEPELESYLDPLDESLEGGIRAGAHRLWLLLVEV